jgi:hypothetical protein
MSTPTTLTPRNLSLVAGFPLRFPSLSRNLFSNSHLRLGYHRL